MPALLPAALPVASAQIVYTDPEDLTVTPGTFGVIYIDLAAPGGGGAAGFASNWTGPHDFGFYLTAGDGARPYVLNESSDGFLNRVAGEPLIWNSRIYRLDAGDLIGAALTFDGFGGWINNNGNNDAHWAAGSQGYLGLKFFIDGVDHYGWAQISYNSDHSLTLYDFAYEAAGGQAIAAGAIPEPAAAAALAGLLAGSAVLYRRRKACQTAG